MQGMTNEINEFECQSSLIPVILIIDAELSLQVLEGDLEFVKQRPHVIFVTFAMIGVWMDLEVKANSAYTSRSIQGPTTLSLEPTR